MQKKRKRASVEPPDDKRCSQLTFCDLEHARTLWLSASAFCATRVPSPNPAGVLLADELHRRNIFATMRQSSSVALRYCARQSVIAALNYAWHSCPESKGLFYEWLSATMDEGVGSRKSESYGVLRGAAPWPHDWLGIVHALLSESIDSKSLWRNNDDVDSQAGVDESGRNTAAAGLAASVASAVAPRLRAVTEVMNMALLKGDSLVLHDGLLVVESLVRLHISGDGADVSIHGACSVTNFSPLVAIAISVAVDTVTSQSFCALSMSTDCNHSHVAHEIRIRALQLLEVIVRWAHDKLPLSAAREMLTSSLETVWGTGSDAVNGAKTESGSKECSKSGLRHDAGSKEPFSLMLVRACQGTGCEVWDQEKRGSCTPCALIGTKSKSARAHELLQMRVLLVLQLLRFEGRHFSSATTLLKSLLVQWHMRTADSNDCEGQTMCAAVGENCLADSAVALFIADDDRMIRFLRGMHQCGATPSSFFLLAAFFRAIHNDHVVLLDFILSSADFIGYLVMWCHLATHKPEACRAAMEGECVGTFIRLRLAMSRAETHCLLPFSAAPLVRRLETVEHLLLCES